MSLVHAFVMSRVVYCNVVFAGAPKAVTNKLQRVLNAAARVVSGTRKFDRAAWRSWYMLSCIGSTYTRACQIQTQHDHETVSERYCSPVPGCSLRSSLCNWIKATFAFCCQSSAGCAVISTEFLRTSGLLCCWSDDVELRNNCVILFTPPPSLVVYWRHFFSQSTSVYSVLGADFSVLMRYINSRFTLLTY